jgi:hypothetical protein
LHLGGPLEGIRDHASLEHGDGGYGNALELGDERRSGERAPAVQFRKAEKREPVGLGGSANHVGLTELKSRLEGGEFDATFRTLRRRV